MLRRIWSATSKLFLLPALVLLLAGHALASSTTATITVGGSEQQVSGSWDHGTITISFNGYVESVSYGQFSSPASVAAALAGMFSRDFAADGLSAKANCPPNGAQIIFTLQGTTPFGTLDIQGPSTSFSFTSSGFQSTSSQVADYGTVTLTVNGVTAAQTNYGDGATPASVAEGLAAGVTSNSPVNIQAVNDELDLQSKTGGSSTNYSYTLQTTSWDSSAFSQPSFMNPEATGALEGGADQNTTGATIYSYCMPSSTNSNCTSSTVSGYDGDSNVTAVIDFVMGTWGYGYDNLNRLMSAAVSPVVDSDTYFCWSYDNWGNRLQQMGSNETISGGGGSVCQGQSGAATSVEQTTPSTANNNQLSATTQNANQGSGYDAAGDVTFDGNVHYLYNANGQICAVESYDPTLDTMIMTGYIYDADGNRVARGMITSWGSCDPSANGFSTQSDYVRDQADNQLSEFVPDANGNIKLEHTNVWAAGTLMATDDDIETHYYLNDWLGTRRVQTDYSGVVEQDCMSLPYGDSETCTPPPSGALFTGKERDSESGNDYFGARYYASVTGRWLSPDRLNLTDDRVLNPANTLNKYVYGGNNPLKYVDPDGKDITVFYEAPSGPFSPGHIMFVAENQQTGDAAAMSFGPVHDSEYGFTPLGSPVNSTTTFDSWMTTDQIRENFSSLTIQTSPEDAQEVINFIRQFSTSTTPYMLYNTNCTTVCRDALKTIGLLPKNNKIWTPTGLWKNLFHRYANPYFIYGHDPGFNYGSPRGNYNEFDLLGLLLRGDNSSVTTTQTNTYIDCSKQANQAGCQQ
jgi:RHS repeat-associated protein